MSIKDNPPQENASRREWLVAVGVLTLMLVVGSHIYSRRLQDLSGSRVTPYARIAALPDKVIGSHAVFSGSPSASYTLVEFADYQCPPCARVNEAIRPLLTRFKGRLRFTFRNYPLRDMHPRAYEAAIVAETARIEGQFWPVHDSLYTHQQEMSEAFLSRLSAGPRPNLEKLKQVHRREAEKQVEKDMNDGDALGVEATPSFFLCGPDNRVTRLGSLSQTYDLIK